MKQSFTEAYNTIINLKRRNDRNACFLFASQFNRVQKLVDFLENHSNRSLDYVSLSDLAILIARSRSMTSANRANDEVSRFLAKKKSEYIVFIDGDQFPKSNFIIKEVCEVLHSLSKRAIVLICSQYAAEISIVYGDAIILEIMCQNEHSLRIKSSGLLTEELYLRNQCEAITTGIFCANADFYNNLLVNKIHGDRLFENGEYFEAYKLYSAAISFHSDHDVKACPIHDFISTSLYIRCIACFFFGKLTERTGAIRLMNRTIREIIDKLKESKMMQFHKQLLTYYEDIFSGMEAGILSRTNYLLFLNEYAF